MQTLSACCRGYRLVGAGAAVVAALLVATTVGVARVAPAQSPAEKTPANNCHIEWAPMRDGVKLATEVYLPAAPGKHPVIMTRTPYNRRYERVGSNCDNKQLIAYANRGYVALNQDVRGRYRSEGVFDPFRQERDDGYDAVEWAAVQPWSNGKVGVFGGSYVGVTTWQAVAAAPPHLVTAVGTITASDYHDNWAYVNGAFDLNINMGWTVNFLAADGYRRSLDGQGLAVEEIDRRVATWIANAQRDLLTEWVWTLPLKSFSKLQTIAPYYYDWLNHPDFDAFWQKASLEDQYSKVTIPTLNIAAWYDVFAVGSVRNFLGARASGGSAAARTGTKLVMTCCGHTGRQGLISWGDQAYAPPDAELDERWFDFYLKGAQNGVDREPTARLLVMVPPDRGTKGSSFYVATETYPLPNTEMRKFYLSSGGRANTRLGDGVLGSQPSGQPDKFVYDPKDPVPTMGGNLCCGDFLMRGALDQSKVEMRKDVLVYTSAPLTEDLPVIGPVTVKLWAASSARDTDFTAKLVDVHHDDIAHNILDRIVRARFRNGSKMPPSLITPGRRYEYTIDLGHTAVVFRKGHRVRVEISSSNFPHFDRNPNTGRPFGEDAQLVTATQTIFHDAENPSHVELPVAPGTLLKNATWD
jgi:putative CocE/NonD family hydrolase